MRTLILISVAAGLFGCATRYEPGTGIITGPGGRRFCAKHNIPLVTVRAYAPKERLCILPGEEYIRLTYIYPNSLVMNISLRRDNIFSKPIRTTYCPACEKAIQIALGNEKV